MEILNTNKEVYDSPSKFKSEILKPFAQSKIVNKKLKLINYPDKLENLLDNIEHLHIEQCGIKNLNKVLDPFNFKSLVIKHEDLSLPKITKNMKELRIEFCKIDNKSIEPFLNSLEKSKL